MNVNDQKKYNECIDFPVEIVGKDGVVRHYSFEESISLYQRRIRLARLRFETAEQREREITHCSNRIAQLRRSFFARYGWESFELVNRIPSQFPIELSGELSAYLRRQFGCGTEHSAAHLDCLNEENDFWMFSIVIEGWQGMLYCSTNNEVLDAFASNCSTVPSENLEVIVDRVSDTDVSFLLTSISGQLNLVEPDVVQHVPSINVAYQAITDGNLIEALAHLIHLVEYEPYNKQAYWAGMILAEQLRVHEQGLLLTNLALSYFPDEQLFMTRKISLSIRLGQWSEASELYTQIAQQIPYPDNRLLKCLFSIQNGEFTKAFRFVKELSSQKKSIQITQRWLMSQIRLTMLMKRLSWISIVLWGCLGFWVHLSFMGLILLSGFVLLGIQSECRRRLHRALLGKGYIQLSIVSNNDVYALGRNLSDSH